MKNPYVTDRPLTVQDLFYGREAVFLALKDALEAGERFFVLYGRTGSGKTSLLNQLELQFLKHVAHVVAWGPLEGVTPSERLAAGLRAVGQPQPPPAPPDADGAGGPLAQALTQLAPSSPLKPTLVCLDGVPVGELASEGWHEAVEATLAALSARPDVALILAVETPASDARVPAPLRRATALTLPPLSEREVEELLTIPVRGRLSYDLESVRRIYRLSGGEPHLAQLYGRMLFDRRLASGWVSVPEVAQVTEEILALDAAPFASLWEQCSPAAQVVLCAFTEMTGRRDLGSAEDAALYLRQLRYEVPREEIDAALAELDEHEMLDRLGGETYRFRGELMRQWLRQTKSALEEFGRQKRYRQMRDLGVATQRVNRMDWLSLVLWLAAGALVVVIALVWRSRETSITWTFRPTPAAEASATPATGMGALPAAEKGVAPGRLVYISRPSAEHKWSIYVMRSDGSDPVRLTDSGANDTSPVWAPDGKRIAFVSDRDGNREIYTMNSDGNAQLNLTRHASEDWTPAWSPDGSRIAFASFRDGNWEIYLMDLKGENLQRLTRNGAADYSPTWSPDGSQIAFVSNRDGNLEIYVMRADGSDQRRLTNDPATDQNPAWSPDGAHILWESYRENNMEIFIANADGSEPRPLSRDAYADDHGPTWSPWGGRIAYFSNRDQGWDIYTYDLVTGERANLTMSPDLEQAPHWGP